MPGSREGHHSQLFFQFFHNTYITHTQAHTHTHIHTHTSRPYIIISGLVKTMFQDMGEEKLCEGLQLSPQNVCVCVCVCVRERERESAASKLNNLLTTC